ncbi:MAG TPA: hypothetical protein VL403_09115 [Candidatus Kryptonia bacterium]|nr:hypothetical protein [Candidatus Kryptonia bacterium]
MAAVHRAFAGAFAVLLDPFAALPPLIGLTLVSAAAGMLVLVAFRLTSNPPAVRVARQRAQAHLLAIRLYRDDLTVVLRSQRALVRALMLYVGLMLVPFVVLLVPFGLLFAQLDARYATRALHPGERALVQAVVTDDTLEDWRLEGTNGVVVESPPVRIRGRAEIVWRIRVMAPGCHALTLVSARARVAATACVASDDTGAAPQRSIAGVASLFTAPTEPVIDDTTGVKRIEIGYPQLALRVRGWQVNWVVVFLVVSAAVALLLRRPFGVEF